MKKILFTLICAFVFIGLSYSQSPSAINYQAIARDGSGNLLASQNLTARLGVYSGAGGTTTFSV